MTVITRALLTPAAATAPERSVVGRRTPSRGRADNRSMHTLRIAATAVALFAAMCICAALGRRDRAAIFALILLSLVWLGVDGDFEGPILFDLTKSNGVTLADLVGVAGIATAGALWWRARKRA